MGKNIQKVFPGCLGASIGVTLIQLFRNPDLGAGNLLFHFVVTFIITMIILTVCVGMRAQTKQK